MFERYYTYDKKMVMVDPKELKKFILIQLAEKNRKEFDGDFQIFLDTKTTELEAEMEVVERLVEVD